MSNYISYYDNQVGGGSDGVVQVFSGHPYQRGHGIGSFLAGLFRRALPILASGARTVGKEALRAGLHILDDMGSQKVPFKQALNYRVREAGGTLKRKAEEKLDKLMSGEGYKNRVKRLAIQSKVSRGVKRIVKRQKKSCRKKQKRLVKKARKNKKVSRKTAKRRKTKSKPKSKKRKTRDIFGPA